jgi:hypothetical protein
VVLLCFHLLLVDESVVHSVVQVCVVVALVLSVQVSAFLAELYDLRLFGLQQLLHRIRPFEQLRLVFVELAETGVEWAKDN